MRLLTALLIALALPASAADIENGRRLYEQHCTQCHGMDGLPNLPGSPDLSQPETMLRTDAEILDSIRFGVRTMPGYEAIFDRREMLDVLFFTRSLVQ